MTKLLTPPSFGAALSPMPDCVSFVLVSVSATVSPFAPRVVAG